MLLRLLAIALVVALRFVAPSDDHAVDAPAPMSDAAALDAGEALVPAPSVTLARPTSRPFAFVAAAGVTLAERAPAPPFRPPRARA